MDYIITTDTTADLPSDYVKKHNLELLSFNYTIDGTTYDIENELPYKDFYEKMREGSVPVTSQVNPNYAKSFFEEIIKKHDTNILHIAFSSGLSGSYNSACIAAEELMEEYPEKKIIVVDSLCASLGQGLLVHKAVSLKENGMKLQELKQWVEDNKLNICHYFTVDDLIYLFRGGRVSRTSAFAAGILNIKPILHVDNEGHLIPLSKVRGRRKSLNALVDKMEEKIGGFQKENDIIFISHGDCINDAQLVADLVKERLGIESFLINHIGPTIGAHSGPGTIALFFMGQER
jgi:DegV family protein with EDD domain